VARAGQAATTEDLDSQDLILPAEAAQVLRLSERSLGRIDPDALPQIRYPGLPRTVRYRRSDVERLLQPDADAGPLPRRVIS
jgi:hypothetical protein